MKPLSFVDPDEKKTSIITDDSIFYPLTLPTTNGANNFYLSNSGIITNYLSLGIGTPISYITHSSQTTFYEPSIFSGTFKTKRTLFRKSKTISVLKMDKKHSQLSFSVILFPIPLSSRCITKKLELNE